MPPSTVAYFSMEIALEPSIPTYAGGLGVLAGDHLRAAADAGLPLVGVTLRHAGGHFRQRIGDDGRQIEEPDSWNAADRLNPLPARIHVGLERRRVAVAAWRFDIPGIRGGSVPVLLLDTDLPENEPQDRRITDRLYLGDQRHRLLQEAVLGIGGVRMLDALGFRDIGVHHLNEGHAALLAMELLRLESARAGAPPTDPAVVEAVRRRCAFTTHTPVEAGHDKFPLDLVTSVLEPELIDPYRGSDAIGLVAPERRLNMTFLGFNLSKRINGVALRHGQVSRAMFGGYVIDSITNGVHAATWVARPMAETLDRHVPGWREDNLALRYAMSIPAGEIRSAHHAAKRGLCGLVNAASGAGFDPTSFTIGFGRRATAYKRPDLLLSDPDRLRSLTRTGPIQIVYGGKAHPHDREGAELIRAIIHALRKIGSDIRAAYIPDYDMDICKAMVSGADLWLNTPLPPLEASGTSGMKAALNGVPSLSILDGWWLEGCVEGVTGWAIGVDGYTRPPEPGPQTTPEQRSRADAASLYDKLEHTILPLFHDDPDAWARIMRHAIALNGSFFNAQRMLDQYATRAYFV